MCQRIVNQTSGSDFLQGQSWAEIKLLNSAASRSGNIRKEEILPCNKMDAARQGPCPHKWCSSAISQLRSVLEKALSTAHAPPFTGREAIWRGGQSWREAPIHIAGTGVIPAARAFLVGAELE